MKEITPFQRRVFTPPKNGSFSASCNLIFNYQSPGSSFRWAGIRVVRDDT